MFKKGLLILISILIYTTTISAQCTPKLKSLWLLEQVSDAGKSQNPYLIINFNKDNHIIYIGDYPIGTWHQSQNTLEIESEKVPEFSGLFKIIEFSNDNFVYQKDKIIYHYIAYNPEISNNNATYKQLLGTWHRGGNTPAFLKFDTKGQFAELDLLEDGSVTTKGEWLFVPQKNTIVIKADIEDLRGDSQVLQINKDMMILIHDSINYQFDKLPQVSQPEPLDFIYEDIEETQTDEHDLPWSDEAMFGYLKSIKTVNYERKSYQPDIKNYITDNILSKVYVDTQKPEIKFTDYLLKNEEEVQKGEHIKAFLQNTYNHFFPQKDIIPFRVLNNSAQLKVNNQTYYCTVVEGFNGDEKVKYWMINDKPGVFAKIIKEQADDFLPHYLIYELLDIEE